MCVVKGKKKKKKKFLKKKKGEKKKLGTACKLAENMQSFWTGIPEIKPWTFCVFKGSKTKPFRIFKMPVCGKKKFRDSVLIS